VSHEEAMAELLDQWRSNGRLRRGHQRGAIWKIRMACALLAWVSPG